MYFFIITSENTYFKAFTLTKTLFFVICQRYLNLCSLFNTKKIRKINMIMFCRILSYSYLKYTLVIYYILNKTTSRFVYDPSAWSRLLLISKKSLAKKDRFRPEKTSLKINKLRKKIWKHRLSNNFNFIIQVFI